MKKLLTVLAAVLLSVAAFAQLTPSQLVTWTPSVENVDGDLYRVVFTGKVAQGYHTYTLADEFSATEIMDPSVEGGELVGEPYELSTPTEELDEFGDPAKHYYNEIIIAQNVKVDGGKATFTGTIFTNACTGGACKAEYYDFDGNLQSAKRDEVNDRKPCRDIANYTKIRKCAKNSIKLA